MHCFATHTYIAPYITLTSTVTVRNGSHAHIHRRTASHWGLPCQQSYKSIASGALEVCDGYLAVRHPKPGTAL
jgi:hypothetical protein